MSPAANPVLAFLHGLPRVGVWVPAPDQIEGGVPRTYLIRLLPRNSCPMRVLFCDDAVLLATPS